jgi:hypothetical protein
MRHRMYDHVIGIELADSNNVTCGLKVFLCLKKNIMYLSPVILSSVIVLNANIMFYILLFLLFLLIICTQKVNKRSAYPVVCLGQIFVGKI